MPKNLVIVESPAKARTVERYLGSDYKVKSSFGHIRDLPKKGLNIDIEDSFNPSYEISADKKKIVSELKKDAKASDMVWLASDEDREGEAIAWHLTQALGLKPDRTKRIVFHEITQTAIASAVKNPRQVDMKLVDAQQARRVLDRLVGYELSPILWKKVQAGLSAGRVQSVAVRLVVEREREIKDFKAVASFKVTASFTADKMSLPAELNKRLDDLVTAKDWLNKTAQAQFAVADLSQKPARRSPSPPFTTSTLQQEASRRLSFSVRQTMTLAQRLYEAGHITYMRTDSTMLSDFALSQAADYIKSNYGDRYYRRQQYQSKAKNAQEAHEAIRPTSFGETSLGEDEAQRKLYRLIRERALASQMSPAEIEKTELRITISNQPEEFIARGESLVFNGFLKVYGTTKDDVILPPLKIGQALKYEEIVATETFSRAPARFSEAALVKRLEELGIGRPSTYAPTISTIQTRGYVEKGDVSGEERTASQVSLNAVGEVSSQEIKSTVGADQSKLLPTPVAELVTDFLVKYFSSVVDYDFTARVEEDFDNIARGKEAWQAMIKQFYGQFHPLVEKAAGASRQEVSQAREIGVDPASGKKIYARLGRYGPMLQKGETSDEEKPEFAPLPKEATLDSVTLEQALKMLELPRVVGQTEDGQEIKANIGRYGPYIQVGQQFISLKEHDPRVISETEARAVYAAKQVADQAKQIQDFGKLKVLKGPYGPYVTDGKKNGRIPKSMDPATLTEAEAKELLSKAAASKKRPSRRRARQPK